MSGEEQDLLARIGALAGQINRHKSQQANLQQQRQQQPNQPEGHSSGPPYRGSYQGRSASWSCRGGYRGRQTFYPNRTLQVNAGRNGHGPLPSSASKASDGSEWVSRNEGNLSLINKKAYDNHVRNRAHVTEETRLKKLRHRKNRERNQFQQFLSGNAVTSANISSTPSNHEVNVHGIKYRVVGGGKKLVRSPEELHNPEKVPRQVTIAGVTFNRTKNGNLVANRILLNKRGTVKKIDQLCKTFSTTGSCSKGPNCRYVHNLDKVAICKDFLKDGKCTNGDSCDLSHDMTPHRVPNCVHYAKGNCTNVDCPFIHSQATPTSPVCRAFGFYGFCEKGADCTERHVFECPDFSNTGKCKTRGCKLPHRERASVLRNQALAQDMEEDISSDDERQGDSDDVDSDEIAEFIAADSEQSDDDDDEVFIRV